MRALLRDLSKSVCFLDYDGTLCPHLEVWEDRIYGVQDIYHSVQSLAKKTLGVWWNTGRRVESLKSVSEKFLEHSGFFIQGSYHWDAEQKKLDQLGVSFPQEYSGHLLERFKSETQYRLELKSTGARVVALRKTQKKFVKKFVDTLGLNLEGGWEWRIGERGAELLHEKFSKGKALEYAFEKGFVPANAIPVVAGDDLFDRPAMEFALSRGGYAILVGDACGWITEIPHRSSQVVFFREPKDFLQFLK